MNDLETHKLAKIFPMMNEEDFKNLKDDIKVNGFDVRRPIILYEGMILDGRNRYRACQENNIVPVVEEYVGDDALGYVISNNLNRRHLTESQRACIALDVLPLLEAQARKRQLATLKQGDKLPDSQLIDERGGRAADGAARTFGTNRQYISDAKKIKAERPEVFNAILKGDKTISEVKTDLKKEARQQAIEEKRAEIIENNLEQPKGLYDVVSVDSPWSFNQTFDDEGNRGITPYPTMTQEELKKIVLPIKDDAVVWLWVTNQRFREAFELLEAWGLEPKTILTWNKVNMGVGRFLRNVTEHCILAFKGKPYFNNTKWTTLITEVRTKHSAKPNIFFKMVDDICEGRKLDYFKGKKREGWDGYGDEVTE